MQEVAEPAEVTAPPADSEDPSEELAEKQPQTPDERKQNAARRRQQEQQTAIDNAVQEALRRERETTATAMKDFFARAGLKNTITGEPITTMGEFDAWKKEFDQEQLNRQLKAGKLTTEGLAAVIGEHPAVKQAQQLVAQSEAIRQEQEMAAAKARINAEIAEIGKMDKSITCLEDLTKAPCWDEVYARTRRGYTLTDAYYAVNRERLDNAKAEAARQQAMNNVRGKAHMTPTSAPTGTGAVSVPAAEMAMFRQFLPYATDAEIQAYYNKYKNN